ncbi:uncharacterized protein VICG_00260 [Vittaforma corneae ATCC 50505]|uniref:Uncharacterized protein n=1 Tax=Vittaforma corneae (strain ATCC 50505) TaxID=993615 RepID=L2GR06_VITCO|nr:uncharacterized protein VICG_00260 [Vittaforma corneae ATCC 50505]ELA42945.1 hypothetical protein VICG_00260 [Vittaforma corneae ATCC 50505]
MADPAMNMKKLIETSKNTVLHVENGQHGAVIEICYPTIDLSVLEDVKARKHVPHIKNDVYESANVECELECDVTLKHPIDESVLARGTCLYEYYCESYDAYIKSEAKTIKSRELSRRLYEDDSFLIFSEDTDALVWHCLFKSPEIHSVRELANIENLDFLRQKTYQLLSGMNISHSQVCLFFDYQGKCSHLLLNIADISNGLHSLESCGKFIYFDTLLKNIKIDKTTIARIFPISGKHKYFVYSISSQSILKSTISLKSTVL